MRVLIIISIIVLGIIIMYFVKKYLFLILYYSIFKHFTNNIPKLTLNKKYNIHYSSIIKDIELPTSLRVYNNIFYITSKTGKFYKNNGYKSNVLYDFSNLQGFISDSEAGLMCVELDPNFHMNNMIYFTYTITSKKKGFSLELILARYKLINNILTNNNILLSIFCPELYHHGGTIHFKDDYIYLSVGDGGPQVDPNKNAQNPNLYLGKILRINVKGKDIPIQSKNIKIIAMGLRNPWSFSISNLGIFVGDVGLTTVESIYLLPNINPNKPYNLGWNYYEGGFHRITLSTKSRKSFYQPIFKYGRKYGHAVIGGYYVNDLYIFGDYTGIVRILQYSNKQWNLVGEKNIDGYILNFAYYDNTVYLLGNKTIYKLIITKI